MKIRAAARISLSSQQSSWMRVLFWSLSGGSVAVVAFRGLGTAPVSLVMVVVCVATVFAGWQLIRTPVVIGTPRGLLWWFRMEGRVRHARWERVSWMQWSSDGIVPLLKIRMRASEGSNNEVGDRNLELTAPAPFAAQLTVRQITGWWYARSLLPRVDGEGPLLLLRPDRMRRLQSRIRAIETDRRVRR